MFSLLLLYVHFLICDLFTTFGIEIFALAITDLIRLVMGIGYSAPDETINLANIVQIP